MADEKSIQAGSRKMLPKLVLASLKIHCWEFSKKYGRGCFSSHADNGYRASALLDFTLRGYHNGGAFHPGHPEREYSL
jgi:hypothetical protein